jgi:transcriptional regulator GlxA family with amidase domain
MSLTKASPVTAVFVIPPSVHLLDITGPAHVFYEAASYGAPVKLVFCTMYSDETESVSTSSLAFHKLVPYDQLKLTRGDIIFVPGLESGLLDSTAFLARSRSFLKWITKQHEDGVITASVCTGAFLLAAAGLLEGRSCTTHWKYVDRMRALYPGINLLDNRLFVREDGIYTSAGVSSGIDLALYLVEQLWGPQFAADIAKEVLIYFRRMPEEPQLNIYTQYRNHLDHRIHHVQDMLLQSMKTPSDLEAISIKVNMSVRNLTRSFKKTTGITIGEYLERLRVEQAKRLLDEGQTMTAAATACGLKSTHQLRQVLKRYA